MGEIQPELHLNGCAGLNFTAFVSNNKEAIF
jgi:hypothetical protein